MAVGEINFIQRNLVQNRNSDQDINVGVILIYTIIKTI